LTKPEDLTVAHVRKPQASFGAHEGPEDGENHVHVVEQVECWFLHFGRSDYQNRFVTVMPSHRRPSLMSEDELTECQLRVNAFEQSDLIRDRE
jgi:hypothetical protein